MPDAVNEAHTFAMGAPLPFSDTEYAGRNDETRRRMAAANLDALLLFHQESMFYLFGYDQLGYWVYQTAIMTPGSRDIRALSRIVDHDLIVGLPNVHEVRTWIDDDLRNPGQITVEMLREMGVLRPGARIGIELQSHALLPIFYKAIIEALPEDVTLVDASHLVTDQRIAKSDSEIVYMREAGKVMDAAYAAAFETFREGMRETEILGAAMSAMFAAGGHVPAIVPPFATGPRTLSRTHGAAVDRRVRVNEPMTIEPGCSRHRYHAVGVQTRWLGEPPAKVQETFDGLLTAIDAATALIRPGVTTSAVAIEMNRALDEAGLLIPGSHHGYGTGIGYPPTWLDTLRIKTTDPYTLQKNTTFFLLTQFGVEGVSDLPVTLFAGVPVVVTEDGCEVLSSTPLSLT